MTIQDVDQSSSKYISHDKTESNWVDPDRIMIVPESHLNLLNPVRLTGTSTHIFVRAVG